MSGTATAASAATAAAAAGGAGNASTTTLGTQEIVKAMYSYETNQESHLPLVAGEFIVVLEKDPSGWWIGYVVVAVLSSLFYSFCCFCVLFAVAR